MSVHVIIHQTIENIYKMAPNKSAQKYSRTDLRTFGKELTEEEIYNADPEAYLRCTGHKIPWNLKVFSGANCNKLKFLFAEVSVIVFCILILIAVVSITGSLALAAVLGLFGVLSAILDDMEDEK